MLLFNTPKEFFRKIILPLILAILLIAITIFMLIIPTFERNLLDSKREMIRELTRTAWSILEEFEEIESAGSLTREEAQQTAIVRIRDLRYGLERKDYFWITDMHPMMIMHPYRLELNGTDLSDYRDPEGKKLFVEVVKAVRKTGEGYVDYRWQWKDDATRIVPKLSYVKTFKPWGWIIGTGIYVEDVAEEIAALTARLIIFSLCLLLILALILVFVMQQSLKIERKKQGAERSLRLSEARYHALVDASTEGLVMLLGSEYVFANRTMYKLLEHTDPGNNSGDLETLLTGGTNIKTSTGLFFAGLLKGSVPESQFNGQMITRSGNTINVLLNISDITFGDRHGYTIIVKDVSSQKQITEQLDESQAKFNNLTNSIQLGVFRTTMGRNGKFIEANRAAMDILGFNNQTELFSQTILDLFHEGSDRKAFVADLMDQECVRNSVIQIRRGDGRAAVITVSAVLVKDDTGKPVFCDGIMEDITERMRMDEQRDNLMIELQTSMHFLNQSVRHFAREIISCSMNEPIHRVAALMSQKHYSAALIKSHDEQFVGIVTDRDIRERAVAVSMDLNRPVFEIMTSPLISISEKALVYEVFSAMRQKSTRHIAIRDNTGEIIGTITSEEILQVQRSSSAFLLREIANAETVDDVITAHDRLPVIVKTLVDSGAQVKVITRIISSVSDAIVRKLIQNAQTELGAPPVPFAFIALGSEGREEQTLITDQDNAIIYDDFPDSRGAHDYFVSLGIKVCNWLDQCGYVFCKGENMAMNPKWSQPLSVWKENFSRWINTSDPQDLIAMGIFFDFRCIYGDQNLMDRLASHVFDVAENKAAFFQHLVKNCLTHRLPLGFLGNIVVTSSGEHPETFDIKKAIMPVTDFARIYALKNSLRDTNTLDRLQRLNEINVLKSTTFNELVQAYNFLMQIRFKHQIMALNNNQTPNNFIKPEMLTQVEQKTLKNTFSQITGIQKKLSYEFTGDAL